MLQSEWISASKLKIWKSYEILKFEENSSIEITVRQEYLKFTAIWVCKNIKFPDIEGRDEGFKISRRLPTGSTDFKLNWLILPLRPPDFLRFRQISSDFVRFRQISPNFLRVRVSKFLSHMATSDALDTSNRYKNIQCFNLNKYQLLKWKYEKVMKFWILKKILQLKYQSVKNI